MLEFTRKKRPHRGGVVLSLAIVLAAFVAVSSSIPKLTFVNQVEVLSRSVDDEANAEMPATTFSSRIAYITFAYLGDPAKFANLIFGALDTYLRDEHTYFVVMIPQWKQSFEQLCSSSENRPYCDRLTIIWVDCPEGNVGHSPCCKMEKGLVQIWDEYQGSYDWFLYMDDDNYLRTAELQFYLSTLDPSQVLCLGTSEPRALALQYFDSLGPEIKRYNCSRGDPNFKYTWGQPAIFSVGAMARVVNGFRYGGLVSISNVYAITHDVAIQVFSWMYSLPSLTFSIRNCHEDSNNHRWIGNQYKLVFGCHGIANLNFAKPIMSAAPLHNLYEGRKSDRLWSLTSPQECKYLWHNATGFRQTRTYKLYGDPSTWVDKWHQDPYPAMPDCSPDGP